MLSRGFLLVRVLFVCFLLLWNVCVRMCAVIWWFLKCQLDAGEGEGWLQAACTAGRKHFRPSSLQWPEERPCLHIEWCDVIGVDLQSETAHAKSFPSPFCAFREVNWDELVWLGGLNLHCGWRASDVLVENTLHFNLIWRAWDLQTPSLLHQGTALFQKHISHPKH